MEGTEIYRKMLDGMPGGFFVYHADGDEELIDINATALRIFGCETIEEFKELTGYTFKGLVHPEDIENVERSIAEQIKSNEYAMDYIEYRIIRKDGAIRWVEDYGHFIHTEDYGDVFYVFIEDATDRMNERTEKLEQINCQLRKAYSREKQYRNAILSDAISYFEVNISRDEVTSEVIQVIGGKQQNLFKYLGIAPITKYSELVDFVMENRKMADDDTYFKFLDADRLIRCYEKGEWEQNYDTWVVDHNGRKKLLRYIFLLGRDDDTKDIIGLYLARDLTNIAAGRTLINLAIDQDKAANEAKDSFLSNMSHDLRTPLNGIIGYTKVIREVHENKELLKTYLEKIEFLSSQILNTVDGSLEYSRLEAGKSVLHEVRGDVFELVEEVKDMVLPISKIKEMNFIVNTEGVTAKPILIDLIRVKKIIFELIDNAVKYTEPGGNVEFKVSEREGAPKGYAKYDFIIKDDGDGMSDELLERIYEPFERGYEIMEGGVIGSGFGLSVVKGLVGMMEGSIEVESTPGEGSTFIVTILFKLADVM